MKFLEKGIGNILKHNNAKQTTFRVIFGHLVVKRFLNPGSVLLDELHTIMKITDKGFIKAS